MDCPHIWKIVYLSGYNERYYSCIKCKESIKTKDVIPCFHNWNEIEHSYGPNYIKYKCSNCDEIKVDINSKNKI